MKSILKLLILPALVFSLYSCGEEIAVVDSGTYKGEVAKVKAEAEEIYVMLDENKKIELYFTDKTELMRDTLEVNFSELKEGQKVEVTVEKVGKRLDPIKVVILD